MYQNRALQTLFLFLLAITLTTSCEGEKDLNTYINTTPAISFEVKNQNSLPSDSLTLLLPENATEINFNVPFKVYSNKLYVLTNNYSLLRYDLAASAKTLMYEEVIPLPVNVEKINDFAIFENGTMIVSYDKQLVVRYHTSTHLYDTLFFKGDIVYTAMPYVGYSYFKRNDKYIAPIVEIDDLMQGKFLSIYDASFERIKGIGNSGYEHQLCKLPFYDTPILSNILDGGSFYTSFSSQNKLARCTLNDDLEIELNEVYSTNEVDNNKNGIPEDQLYDYKLVSDLYVTAEYWSRIVATQNRLFRIKKLEQPFSDAETGKKNIMLNSPWVLDVYDLSQKIVHRRLFGEKSFMYLAGFLHNNTYYIPKQSNTNKIVLYGFI